MLRRSLVLLVVSSVALSQWSRVRGRPAGVQQSMVRQCSCNEAHDCKRSAIANVTQCFKQCNHHLESWSRLTFLPLVDCFQKDTSAAVEADECLFREMGNFCAKDGNVHLVPPSDFAQHTGFDIKMDPGEKVDSSIPLVKQAYAQFKVFHDFFQCSKKCVHRQMSTCFARKRCAIALPSKPVLNSVMERCNRHNPKLSYSLLTTCQCLAYQKAVTPLYGMCPIISNPTFIENS